MPSADLDLARRLRSGDESAFEAFFAEYFPRVYRFARVRLGGDNDAAEEVAQATVTKALAKVSTYRGEAALFTWLCSFCRHEIAAWFARNGQRPVSLEEDSTEMRAVLEAITALSSDDPEQEYERAELSRSVHATLDHLPLNYRQALVWKYLEGIPVQDVASKLGLGYKAAESLLTRARQAFREGFASLAGDCLGCRSATALPGSRDE